MRNVVERAAALSDGPVSTRADLVFGREMGPSPIAQHDLIRAGAQAAVERLGELKPPAIEVPPTIEITFLTADMAEACTALRGVERTDHRTVTFLSEDPLQAYRTFVTIVTLTRGLGD
jgi:D-amino peptidase